MSAAFFIVLDTKAPGFDTEVNGKYLSQDVTGLKTVAESLDIRPLEEYVSYSPEEAVEIMEDMGIDADEIAGMELPEQNWYDPQEGLDWVRKVSEHLEANPLAVTNQEGVLADLADYASVFERAKAIGARWNLKVDF